MSKLTEKDVAIIRSSSESAETLALTFEISAAHVRKIKSGKTWKQNAEARPRYEYMLGQLILVEWYNPKTDKNEWREAKFLHHHDADDRLYRAEIEIDGRRVTGIAPECIKPREPAAPQPRKAPPRGEPAKAASETVRDIFEAVAALKMLEAELERVKQQLAETEQALRMVTQQREDYWQQRDELLAALKTALPHLYKTHFARLEAKAAIANAEKEAR